MTLLRAPHYRPILIALIPALVVTLVMLVTVWSWHSANHQRRASCKATITALEGVRATSAAGIRPEIDAGLLKSYPPSVREGAFRQRAATLAENARRRIVIVQMNKAIAELEASSFCS